MDFQSPYALLKHIESEIQRENQSSDVEHAQWQGLYFTLLDHVYLTPLHEVSEIMKSEGFLSLPQSKHWVKGVVELRGELVVVNDTHDLLFQVPLVLTRDSRILLIKYERGHIGFLVSKIFGIVSVPERNDKNNEKGLGYEIDGIKVPFIHFNEIINSPDFSRCNSEAIRAGS